MHAVAPLMGMQQMRMCSDAKKTRKAFEQTLALPVSTEKEFHQNDLDTYGIERWSCYRDVPLFYIPYESLAN